MKVNTLKNGAVFKFDEQRHNRPFYIGVSKKEALEVSKKILEFYEPKSLAVEEFNWIVKDDYIVLLKLFRGPSGFSVAEDELYLNYNKRTTGYELNTYSEGGNFKTFFTEEEFLAFAEPLNLEKFFEPVKN